jgi:serine/threonine-protein kinase
MASRTVRHYQLLERLGGGGMGDVYKARDTKLGRVVALKFLPPGWSRDEELKARFLREARAASSVDHSNVCTIYDVDATPDGQLFIAMACYEGETLREIMDRGPVAPATALDYATQIARGLKSVHALNIIHRDIKPSNVFVTRESVVKILDFGLAKFGGEAGITMDRVAVGTVAYMSPEQTAGLPIDVRSDIWSLGVVLFEMISGRLPFEGDRSEGIIHRIRHEDAPRLSDCVSGLPESVTRLVAKCLSKDVGARYGSASELLEELAGLRMSERSLVPASPSARRLPSIAVLPFVNLDADDERQYFSDGLTDELINALARIDGLSVVPRTSAFEFKGRSENVQKIGQRLDVGTVLEGTVRKSGSKLRITTQLIDVASGYSMWSERYDREVEDVFAIQEEIAQRIVRMLEVRLSGEVDEPLVKRGGRDIEAYNLYLMGRYYWHMQTPEAFVRALRHLEEALTIDPDFAQAHSGIADYYVALASWGLAPPDQVWPRAREAALRALAADATLAEAHTSLGDVHMYFEWNWSAAGVELQEARRLNPSYVPAHVEYTVYLILMKRLREALRVAEEARERDPLSPATNVAVAATRYYSRDFAQAIAECRRGLELHPAYPELHAILGLASVECGDFGEAVAAFERGRDLTGGSPLMLGSLGWCHARSGRPEEAARLLGRLEELEGEMYVAPLSRALIHIGLGDADSALLWLERSAEKRDALLCYASVWPVFDPLRRDPRLVSLVRRMGLDVAEQTTPSIAARGAGPLGEA